MSSSDGLWAEALAAAVSQSTEDAIEGMRAFLEKRRPEFRGV
jgi:enoyl-CoA hydratase/carnithine racemase